LNTKTGYWISTIKIDPFLPHPIKVFVFPAFTDDYSAFPGRTLPGFTERFRSLLEEAAQAGDPLLLKFDFQSNNFVQDELRNQLITCIYSCTASLLLRQKNVIPQLSAGFSMGIYAAMVDAGAISISTALELIRLAFVSQKNVTSKTQYGMGIIIGLDRHDIGLLIDRNQLEVEISNQMASFSFIVSGLSSDVNRLLSLSREEGALHTRILQATLPYHAHWLEPGARIFAEKIRYIGIQTPVNPVISLIDQTILTTPDALRDELRRNLYQPLNWLATCQRITDQGMCEFIGCGPAASLAKNARFVEGNYRFLSFDQAMTL
jgi:malonyl CoA-acyl carrier protein transacylase